MQDLEVVVSLLNLRVCMIFFNVRNAVNKFNCKCIISVWFYCHLHHLCTRALPPSGGHSQHCILTHIPQRVSFFISWCCSFISNKKVLLTEHLFVSEKCQRWTFVPFKFNPSFLLSLSLSLSLSHTQTDSFSSIHSSQPDLLEQEKKRKRRKQQTIPCDSASNLQSFYQSVIHWQN